MQKVGLAPKKNKNDNKKKEKTKGKPKSKSAMGGNRESSFSKEEKKATLGKLRGHQKFKSKKRYKRR